MLHKVVSHIRHNGFAATSHTIARTLASVLWWNTFRTQQEVLLEGDVLSIPPESDDIDTRLSIRKVVPDDRPALENCIKTHNIDAQMGLRRMAKCLENGYHGIVGEIDGEIIAYGWLVGPEHWHPARRLYGIHLSHGECFACDLFVAPAHRKHHMGREFLVHAGRLIGKQGITRIVTTVRDSNRRSLLVHLQAGFREYERKTVRVLFNRFLICDGRILVRDGLWL